MASRKQWDSTVGVPHLILDFVIDALICSMKPLPLEALATEEFSVTRVDGYALERRIFRSMSLVHRTWTDVARRGLWHRTILSAHDLIVLRLPVSAPDCLQVRELALTASGFENRLYWGHFIEILRQTPNLRSLYVDIEVEEPTDPGFLEFLQQLRTHTYLERLWLVGDMEGCYKDILLCVSSLRSLKSLVMDTVSSSDEETDALPRLDPPRGLDSIAIIDALDWLYFSCLIRPREGHRISNLAFSLDGPDRLEEDPESVEQFYQCLSSLKTLHISTNLTDNHSEDAIHNECLGLLLSKAQGLQQFTLSASSIVRTPHLRLPDTLIVFHVHHDVGLSAIVEGSEYPRQRDDKNIASIISESRPIISSLPVKSCLEKVVLSFVQGDLDLGSHVLARLQNEIYPETQMACLLAGVALTFETYASPYFGTLAESGPFVG